jgi:hypothetical protein
VIETTNSIMIIIIIIIIIRVDVCDDLVRDMR